MTRSTSDSDLLIVGADHRSSSMALRDRLLVDDAARPGFFARLKSAGIDQAVLVSTSDRVEVMAVHENAAQAAGRIREILADHAGVPAAELAIATYAKEGDEAVRHLFAVTASLDSLVLGEPQILGEIKASHRLAKEAGFVGEAIDRYLDAAYDAAKRVRQETEIGRRPVSIAAAAVQTARDLHGDLKSSRGLLIGAGEMGETVAAALRVGGLGDLVVTHPSPRRAEALGQRLDCHVAPIDDLPRLLASADIVLTAMNTRHYIVLRDAVTAAIKARRHKPMFLIDTGIPGDIEPAVDSLEDAFRFTLDDLERITREGRASHESESDAAWRIIEDESRAFRGAGLAADVAPTIRALRRHFEAARAQALAESGDDAEKATRLLVDRLLDRPSAHLRALATDDRETEGGRRGATLEALKRLFGIDPEQPDGTNGDQ